MDSCGCDPCGRRSGDTFKIEVNTMSASSSLGVGRLLLLVCVYKSTELLDIVRISLYHGILIIPTVLYDSTQLGFIACSVGKGVCHCFMQCDFNNPCVTLPRGVKGSNFRMPLYTP